MNHIRCNFCGADDTEVVNHGRDLLLDKEGDFYLVRCRQCGLIYQNPQLSFAQLSAHYPSDYLPYQAPAPPPQAGQQPVWGRFCDRIIARVPQPGHILDVGCATGGFLQAMQQRGWQVQGIEPVPHAAAYARQQLGPVVQTGFLEDAAYADQQFDVVTLWDVLEHVADPLATLQEVARILKPGGLLAFSVPNPACLEASLFGAHWLGWERPRHLHLIPPKLVPAYLERAGLQFQKIESFNGRLRLTLLSIEFALKAKGYPEQRWRPWLNWAYNMPLRIATWPIYKLAERFNQTTIMTVFAHRPLSV